MNGAGCKEHMDPWLLCFLQCFVSTSDVAIVATSQTADGCAANNVGDLADSFEVARRSDWKAGFDDVDSQVRQSPAPLPASQLDSYLRQAIALRRAM